jgi:uncharacterized protein
MIAKKFISILSTLLIVVGAVNWGLIGALRFNLVTFVTNLLSLPDVAVPIVYALVGLAGLYQIFRRDFYLPFLGKAVFPCGSLVEKTPQGADTEVEITTRPGVNVIYWAAEPGKDADFVAENPWEAYSEYANTGVSKSDPVTGKATLAFRRPMTYHLPAWKGGKVVKPHVHYRTCCRKGMLGPVKTVNV